jgi:hypothetical protein
LIESIGFNGHFISMKIGLNKEHSISPEQLMWQQRDQELALTRERERATKEKERQRREREGGGIGGGGVGGGMWPPGIGGIGVLNDHIELDKESYSYVQFAREGKLQSIPVISRNSHDILVQSRQYWSGTSLSPLTPRVQLSGDARSSDAEAKSIGDSCASSP